jgi:carboxymethylenebutenolidase
MDVNALTRTISFGGRRDATTGYMAFSNRVGPSVLVLHDFMGMGRSAKDFADGLRDEGFTVLVPDLYDGEAFRDVEHAHALGKAPDTDAIMRHALAGAEHLTSNWHPTLGVVGFSLGAELASALAQEIELEATVLYYGAGAIAPGRWRGALQGHFAGHDERCAVSEVSMTFTALAERGVETELHVYTGARALFANHDASDAYEKSAEASARGRTFDFLRYHLA